MVVGPCVPSRCFHMHPSLHCGEWVVFASHHAVVDSIWNPGRHCSLGRVVIVAAARADFPSSPLLVGSRFDLHRHVATTSVFSTSQRAGVGRGRPKDSRQVNLHIQDGQQQLEVQGRLGSTASS